MTWKNDLFIYCKGKLLLYRYQFSLGIKFLKFTNLRTFLLFSREKKRKRFVLGSSGGPYRLANLQHLPHESLDIIATRVEIFPCLKRKSKVESLKILTKVNAWKQIIKKYKLLRTIKHINSIWIQIDIETCIWNTWSRCCGSGSGIRCFLDPGIRIRDGKKSDPDPRWTTQTIFSRA